MNKRAVLILFLSEAFLAFGQCPCEVSQQGVLSCSKGTISHFPTDIENFCPSMMNEIDKISAINLQDQPMSELISNGFSKFSNILQLALSFNNIDTIKPGAFYDLGNVISLILRGNNISSVPVGVFDPMVSLTYLDLDENPIQNITTQSWTLCHEVEHGRGSVEGVKVFQDFSKTDTYGDEYCTNWIKYHSENFGECEDKNGILDCSGKGNDFDYQGLGCHLKDTEQYEFVRINFPKDEIPSKVENFGKGESADFFKDFNGAKDEYNSHRRSLTLYGTKFDLSTLQQSTNSSITQNVTIKADTVYMSQPLSINYKLIIRARVVSIDHALTMEMPADMFKENEMRINYDQHVLFNNQTRVRHRQFGLVDIVDVAPESAPQTCYPSTKEAADADTKDAWFDSVTVNLMYVCASAVQPENNNLALGIAGFNLDYHSDRKVVGDARVFVSAQRFQKIKELGQSVKAHNVPSYSLETISAMSEVLQRVLFLYWESETNQNIQLKETMDNVGDIERKFQIIQQQQEYYYQQELSSLEEIFATQENNWHWDFQHRNATDSAINDALGATGDLINDIQKEKYEKMLEEAKRSVEHYQEVIDVSNDQIGRYSAKVDLELSNIKDLNNQFTDATSNLNTEVENFENAVQEWIHDQKVKAAVSYFTCVVKICVGVFAGGEVNPAGIINGVFDFIDMLIELAEIAEQINGVIDLTNDLNFDGFQDMTNDPKTDFMSALNNAMELKLKAPRFNELHDVADIQIRITGEQTDFEIDGTKELMMAITRVSNLGRSLVTATCEFADDLIQLAERKDELKLAEANKERAVENVETIKKAIDDLQNTANDYHNEMNQNQMDYQEALKRMEEEFEHMNEELKEQYRKEIYEKFERFQAVYQSKKMGYIESLERMKDSVQDKIYGLKIASMNQRSMMMVLYSDYCDTLFYHAFKTCNEKDVPLLSDDLDVLIEKLGNIRWDTITNLNNLPGEDIM